MIVDIIDRRHVEMDPENPLPFQPSLTPAMGISGVILLLSGLAFAVIGIKNKW